MKICWVLFRIIGEHAFHRTPPIPRRVQRNSPRFFSATLISDIKSEDGGLKKKSHFLIKRHLYSSRLKGAVRTASKTFWWWTPPDEGGVLIQLRWNSASVSEQPLFCNENWTERLLPLGFLTGSICWLEEPYISWTSIVKIYSSE